MFISQRTDVEHHKCACLLHHRSLVTTIVGHSPTSTATAATDTCCRRRVRIILGSNAAVNRPTTDDAISATSRLRTCIGLGQVSRIWASTGPACAVNTKKIPHTTSWRLRCGGVNACMDLVLSTRDVGSRQAQHLAASFFAAVAYHIACLSHIYSSSYRSGINDHMRVYVCSAQTAH